MRRASDTDLADGPNTLSARVYTQPPQPSKRKITSAASVFKDKCVHRSRRMKEKKRIDKDMFISLQTIKIKV